MVPSDSSFADLRAREFGGASGRVYLNAAAFGPLPTRALHAIERFNTRRWEVDLSDHDLFAPLTGARAAVARLIGAADTEIALTPNTNLGINTAATAALTLSGDRRVILIHDREFPANVYPWLALEQRGYRVEIIAPDGAGLPREDVLLARIAEGDVAAVSVSFVQFASGYRADLAAIGNACRQHNTLFVIDAIQGLGALPLGVRACGADVLACGGQKWLCAPWGSGFTYVRRELIEQFEPILPGWLAFKASQEFTNLLEYSYELVNDAQRFETGSLAFQDYLGLQHAVELLLELGTSRIWQHIRELQEPIADWAASRGVPVTSDLAPERRSGILCIRPPSADAVAAALESARIRCALREGGIRISPHWYNTMNDIDRLIDVMQRQIRA